MAADTEQPQRYDQEFTWVCCANCDAGLWKRFSDHLEMAFIPRGGHRAPRDEAGAVRKRWISVSFEAAPGVKVRCERCGVVNIPALEAG